MVNRFRVNHCAIHRDWPPGEMDMVTASDYDALAASRDERSAQLIEAERRNVALAAELADFRSRLAESCGHRIVANDRIRELEGALRELRTCNEPGCKLCFACLLHIERHVTPVGNGEKQS